MTTYPQALEYLSGLEIYGIKLGLDQVAELLEHCGNPHRDLKFIHIAGTNGKGSVCAMLYCALRSQGFRTAFYSSPHLLSPRERFRIDGRGISESEFAALVERLRPAAEKMREAGRFPTYFEFTTVLALIHFLQSGAEFVVWETGMGGRFDATNIVDPVCSVITSIGLDHCSFLGDTEEKIAFEKAGIIKPGRPVFCGNLGAAAQDVVKSRANELGTEISFSRDFARRWTDISSKAFPNSEKPFMEIALEKETFRIPLVGAKQVDNFLLAASVLDRLSRDFGFDFCGALHGMESLKWPARFQILPDGCILDGAHNPQAVQALVSSLQEYFPSAKFAVVYAALADKDVSSILPILDKVAEEFIFVPIRASRKSYSGDELKKIASGLISTRARTAGSVPEALQMRGTSRILATGSLYLAGEVLKEYFPEQEIVDI